MILFVDMEYVVKFGFCIWLLVVVVLWFYGLEFFVGLIFVKIGMLFVEVCGEYNVVLVVGDVVGCVFFYGLGVG